MLVLFIKHMLKWGEQLFLYYQYISHLKKIRNLIKEISALYFANKFLAKVVVIKNTNAVVLLLVIK